MRNIGRKKITEIEITETIVMFFRNIRKIPISVISVSVKKMRSYFLPSKKGGHESIIYINIYNKISLQNYFFLFERGKCAKKKLKLK